MKPMTSWFRSHHARVIVVAGVAAMTLASAARAELISVDFGPVVHGTGAPEALPFTGPEAQATAAHASFAPAAQWNHLAVAHLSQPAQVDAVFPALINSTGAATTATLSLFGTLEAYAQFSPPTDELRSDYLFFNSPNHPSTQIDWSVTGLTPSTRYVMFNYSHMVSDREFLMLVDTNGDGSLGDETALTVISAGTLMAVITSSPAGTILGRAFGNGPNDNFDNEADWSGFQLATVETPIPVEAATWSRIKAQY